MIAWLLLGAALAQDTCDAKLQAPPEAAAVAWISPVRKRAHGGTWLQLNTTKDLVGWLSTHPEATPGDLLRHVGLRKRTKDPKKKRYKITIFEVSRDQLCRPLDGLDQMTLVEGVFACPGGLGRATGRYEGCGVATDFNTDASGPAVYRGQWRDVARRGFCMLPLERFVAEGAR